MRERPRQRGGFCTMPLIACTKCGRKFRIGKDNPRRICANAEKCQWWADRMQMRAMLLQAAEREPKR